MLQAVPNKTVLMLLMRVVSKAPLKEKRATTKQMIKKSMRWMTRLPRTQITLTGVPCSSNTNSSNSNDNIIVISFIIPSRLKYKNITTHGVLGFWGFGVLGAGPAGGTPKLIDNDGF